MLFCPRFRRLELFFVRGSHGRMMFFYPWLWNNFEVQVDFVIYFAIVSFCWTFKKCFGSRIVIDSPSVLIYFRFSIFSSGLILFSIYIYIFTFQKWNETYTVNYSFFHSYVKIMFLLESSWKLPFLKESVISVNFAIVIPTQWVIEV